MLNIKEINKITEEAEQFFNKLTRKQIDNAINEQSIMGSYEAVIQVSVAEEIIQELKDAGYEVKQEKDPNRDLILTKINWKNVPHDEPEIEEIPADTDVIPTVLSS